MVHLFASFLVNRTFRSDGPLLCRYVYNGGVRTVDHNLFGDGDHRFHESEFGKSLQFAVVQTANYKAKGNAILHTLRTTRALNLRLQLY